MSARYALVVDDSKTARIVLRRMLERHKLAVDTAESVGDALDYLSLEHPDVIFMDHMMPGMDGFQALKLIKNNPETAMIPVMMYTSKGGEVYLGQARALGAVGVLSKQVHPVDLLRALQKLHLVDENGIAIPAPADQRASKAATPLLAEHVAAVELAPVPLPANSGSYDDLKPLLKRLLEEQRAALKKDMLNSCETVASLTATGHYHSSTLGRRLNAALPRLDSLGASGLLLISGLLILPLLWYWGIYPDADAPRVAGQASAAAIGLTEDPAPDETAETHLREQLEAERRDARHDRALLYDTLERALNDGGEYDFDQLALSDERLDTVNFLVSNLASAGFRGTVRLDVHSGRFCLKRNAFGGYDMPPHDLPIEDCEITGGPGAQSPPAGLQSLAFANFLASSPLVNDGRIGVRIVSHGSDQPRAKHPERGTSQTTGAWNRAAQRNNRVEVSIMPEPR